MGQVPATSQIVCVKLKVHMTELFLFAWSNCFSCVEEGNCTCMDKNMNGMVEYSAWNNRGTENLETNNIDKDFFYFHTRTTWRFDQARKTNSVIYTLIAFHQPICTIGNKLSENNNKVNNSFTFLCNTSLFTLPQCLAVKERLRENEILHVFSSTKEKYRKQH